MEAKKFTSDARDVAAMVLAAITITVVLLFRTAAPVATILNGLAAALLLRPRTRWCDRRDLIAVTTAAAAATVVAVVPHSAAPAVTIANAVVTALILRRRR